MGNAAKAKGFVRDEDGGRAIQVGGSVPARVAVPDSAVAAPRASAGARAVALVGSGPQTPTEAVDVALRLAGADRSIFESAVRSRAELSKLQRRGSPCGPPRIRRDADAVAARGRVVWLLRYGLAGFPPLSLPIIARECGGMSHSSVLDAFRRESDRRFALGEALPPLPGPKAVFRDRWGASRGRVPAVRREGVAVLVAAPKAEFCPCGCGRALKPAGVGGA